MRRPLLTLAAATIAASPLRAQQTPMNAAAHVVHTATIHLDAPVDRVFPMFEPEGERHWAPGWDPHYLWPADGSARVGTTFTTDGGGTVWILAEHEPGRRVVYTHIRRGVAGRVEVRCSPAQDGGTTAEVRYDLTALSPDASEPLLTAPEEHFRAWIGHWQTSIDHYLQTGAAAHP
jgi:hypothetical protein